jgi:hypothetical protein
MERRICTTTFISSDDISSDDMELFPLVFVLKTEGWGGHLALCHTPLPEEVRTGVMSSPSFQGVKNRATNPP